jgi:hypothetical protein
MDGILQGGMTAALFQVYRITEQMMVSFNASGTAMTRNYNFLVDGLT